MYKRALMLTAATLALMSSPALAAGPTTISDSQTTQQKTSTTGDLTIAKGGSVALKDGNNSAILTDSSNSVSIESGGTVSNKDTTGATGIKINADGFTGSFTNAGTIDMTGASNSGKTGILITNTLTGTDATFHGGLTLASTSVFTVAGNTGVGISLASGATLAGDMNLGGTFSVGNSATAGSNASNPIAIQILGTLDGNFLNSGTIGAAGTGANGVLIYGNITGAIQNTATIGVTGSSNPKVNGNPIAGSALVIGGDIDKGIFNAGPLVTGGATVAASITANGNNPTVLISSSASGSSTASGLSTACGPTNAMNICGYTDNGVTASLLNRGSITSSGIQPNVSSIAFNSIGTATNTVNLTNGIYNSGTISASSLNDATGKDSTVAVAMSLQNYVKVSAGTNIAALINDNVAGNGKISANVSGSLGGTATGIFIGPNSSLASINNSGTINAAAATTDTTNTTLSAYAINDQSGTLLTIDNSGTISATSIVVANGVATVLDNNAQIAVAADLSNATGNVTFKNTGTVLGNIYLGQYDDTVSVHGTTNTPAKITGDIAFGSGANKLNIGTNASVTGGITDTAGTVDVSVTGISALTLTNKTKGLTVGDLSVDNGSTLGLTLSEAFNQATTPAADALISGNNITLDPGANFKLNYGGFLSAASGTAKFTLLKATNTLSIDVADLQGQIGTVPFLFQDCAGSCLTKSSDNKELLLSLAPKKVGQGVGELPLTGNAATMFPLVNEALAKDDTLGAALVAGVTTNDEAQAAYLSFAPDATGAQRATVISLTDQATGPVAARQRALRMYAAQPGELTLWGQEFAQRLNQGNNTSEGAFRGTGFGFVLGMDAGTPQAGRYGAAFSFFSGNSNEKQPRTSKSNMEWYMLTGYTDWRGKGFFLDSQASVAYGNIKSRRFIKFPTLERTASSKHTGLAGALGVTTGAVFTFGSTSFVPQISIDGMTMREDGYTETGGGAGVNLKVQPVYSHSARGFIGTAIRQDIDMGGFFIQPEGRIGYRYDFLNGGAKIKGQFVSTGSTFTINGPDPDKGNIVAGGSLAVTTGAWSIGLNYDYIRGTHGDVSQVGTISLLGRI